MFYNLWPNDYSQTLGSFLIHSYNRALPIVQWLSDQWHFCQFLIVLLSYFIVLLSCFVMLYCILPCFIVISLYLIILLSHFIPWFEHIFCRICFHISSEDRRQSRCNIYKILHQWFHSLHNKSHLMTHPSKIPHNIAS